MQASLALKKQKLEKIIKGGKPESKSIYVLVSDDNKPNKVVQDFEF